MLLLFYIICLILQLQYKNLRQMIKQLIKKAATCGPVRKAGLTVFRCFPDLAARYCIRQECKPLRAEAEKFFAQPDLSLPEGASREDYFDALKKHGVSLSEYFHQYEFYNKNEEERSEFISRAHMRGLALKLRMMFLDYDNIGLLRDKERFFAHYSPLGFCHRKWLYAPNATYEEFVQLVSSTNCVMKPHDTSLGAGIVKLNKTQDGPELRALYDKCVAQKALIEEFIQGSEAIQAFHPSSLNTIRFDTIAFGGKAVAFGAFVRMGMGDMIIDNAHSGGIFAQINIKTGIIESEGITVDGMRVNVHPDSQKTIMGFQMPHWDEIVEFCLSAARQTKNIRTGWDVVETIDGQLEMIEANSRPDIDVLQSPLQIGIKRKVLDTLTELTGRKITI